MASLKVSHAFITLCSPSEVTVIVNSIDKPKKVTLNIPQQINEKVKKNEENCNYEVERVLVKISPSGQFIAVCSGKKLIVWGTKDWTIVSCRDVVRAASSIVFTHKENYIVLADKSGDVYKFSLSDQEPGQLILGHLSVVLEVLVTKDEKYVITCDRDEKIRVSHFPNAYNIHSFCLGHKEFVSSLKFAPHDESILISGSGDGSIKCWRFSVGLELLSFPLDSLPPGVILKESNSLLAVDSIEVSKKDSSSSLICFTIPGVAKIIVLLLESLGDKITCKYHSVIDALILPIIFSLSDSHLWILYGDKEVNLSVLEWTPAENKFVGKNDYNELIPDISTELKKLVILPKKQESIEYLYKKKYDNVQEYLVKKKARIESSL